MEDLPSTSKDDAFKIIPSQRGGNILMRNGYRYTLRRINLNGHKVWRCVNRKICSAYLVTNNTMIIKEENHKCQQNEIGNEIKLRINECIEKAKNEMTPIPSIYAEVLEDYNNVGLDLIAKIPKYDNIKKNIQTQT